MRYFFLFLFFYGYRVTAAPDTTIVRQQKGILFLSAFNADYDHDSAEVRSVGFFDYFYPDSGSIKKYMLKERDSVFFKHGIRVDRFDQRKKLKSLAAELPCCDSSYCYYFDKFYLVPVIVTYKVYRDYWPFLCRRNFYELRLSDSGIVKFEYERTLMTVVKISADATKHILTPDLPKKSN